MADRDAAPQPTALPTLRAYRSTAARCWMVDGSQGRAARQLIPLFGTDQLPTAFTLDANPFDVGMALQRLNPGHRIIVECTERPQPGSARRVTTDQDDSAQGLQLANAIAAAVYGPKGEYR